MTERRIRVAVIMGGRSSEHEISLASARSVVDALDPARYDTVEIEIGREGRWALPSGNGRVPAALDPGSGPRTGPGETGGRTQRRLASAGCPIRLRPKGHALGPGLRTGPGGTVALAPAQATNSTRTGCS